MLSPASLVLYPVYILCGVAIMYSLMIALAATSIWLGRNQHLYNFWFYITNFSRYPMEIYNVSWGVPLMYFFTFAVPILVVINVPARLLAQPLDPRAAWEWPLAGFAVLATILSVILSRGVFQFALKSYRSPVRKVVIRSAEITSSHILPSSTWEQATDARERTRAVSDRLETIERQ